VVLRTGAVQHHAMLLRFCGTCFLCGRLALPLSGAGLTFFAAAKKVSKESSFSGSSHNASTHSQYRVAQRLSVALNHPRGLVRARTDTTETPPEWYALRSGPSALRSDEGYNRKPADCNDREPKPHDECTSRPAKRKRMNDCCANAFAVRCHSACRAPSP
jgi:hypothetical protein